METETMRRVTVRAKIENLSDLHLVERQLLPPEQIRSLEVDDALVDTGATLLSMPKSLIERLGLKPVRTRKAMTPTGQVTVQMYGTVRLTIQDRDCTTDVNELPNECPVLVGQIPLEQLDFIVDLQGRRLIGNPAHGGEQVIELYAPGRPIDDDLAGSD
jgi:predicted aspartyl protease